MSFHTRTICVNSQRILKNSREEEDGEGWCVMEEVCRTHLPRCHLKGYGLNEYHLTVASLGGATIKAIYK